MRIYWTDYLKSGNIGMFARPRGNDWLKDELLKIKQAEITTVVSLLEHEEIMDLGLGKEPVFCEELELGFINFPIPDRGVPESDKELKKLISRIQNQLDQRQKVGVHCRMGIGRTGLLVGALLKHNGMGDAEIFPYLSEKRTLEMPDTTEQIKWVENFKSQREL